jgi:hypothetical protein
MKPMKPNQLLHAKDYSLSSQFSGEQSVMQDAPMTAYEKIKNELVPLLERSGLAMVKEESHPETFGSAFSEYSGRGLSYRIVWDGRDGRGYIQWLEAGVWNDLKVSAPLADDDDFSSALMRMRIELIEHTALRLLNA